MAQFTFKLHAVLRQRELLEQEKQRDFALAQGELVKEQNELKRLDEVVRVAVIDLRTNQLVGKLNLSFLAAHRRFMLAMQKQGLLQLQKVEAARKKVEEARVILAESAKQTKIIEKLKERQQAAWALAVARKETADLDEISMQLSTINLRESGAMVDNNEVGSTEIGF